MRFLENNKSIRKVLNHSNKFEMIFKNSTTEFKSGGAKRMECTTIIYGIIACLIIGIGVYLFRVRKKTVANKV